MTEFAQSSDYERMPLLKTLMHHGVKTVVEQQATHWKQLLLDRNTDSFPNQSFLLNEELFKRRKHLDRLITDLEETQATFEETIPPDIQQWLD